MSGTKSQGESKPAPVANKGEGTGLDYDGAFNKAAEDLLGKGGDTHADMMESIEAADEAEDESFVEDEGVAPEQPPKPEATRALPKIDRSLLPKEVQELLKVEEDRLGREFERMKGALGEIEEFKAHIPFHRAVKNDPKLRRMLNDYFNGGGQSEAPAGQPARTAKPLSARFGDLPPEAQSVVQDILAEVEERVGGRYEGKIRELEESLGGVQSRSVEADVKAEWSDFERSHPNWEQYVSRNDLSEALKSNAMSGAPSPIESVFFQLGGRKIMSESQMRAKKLDELIRRVPPATRSRPAREVIDVPKGAEDAFDAAVRHMGIGGRRR